LPGLALHAASANQRKGDNRLSAKRGPSRRHPCDEAPRREVRRRRRRKRKFRREAQCVWNGRIHLRDCGQRVSDRLPAPASCRGNPDCSRSHGLRDTGNLGFAPIRLRSVVDGAVTDRAEMPDRTWRAGGQIGPTLDSRSAGLGARPEASIFRIAAASGNPVDRNIDIDQDIVREVRAPDREASGQYDTVGLEHSNGQSGRLWRVLAAQSLRAHYGARASSSADHVTMASCSIGSIRGGETALARRARSDIGFLVRLFPTADRESGVPDSRPAMPWHMRPKPML